MNTTLQLATADDVRILQNLFPLYQHDVSAYDGKVPNRHGMLSDQDTPASLEEMGQSLQPWWSEPERLFPYLIFADGRPAGFNLVAARDRLPEELDVDFVVHEFFVVHAYRARGVAEQAALLGFERHRGSWEVVTYPNSPQAIGFWRRTIGKHTDGHFDEHEGDHLWGRKVIFRFDNGAGPEPSRG